MKINIFYASMSVNSVEGAVRIIMKVSCLETQEMGWLHGQDKVFRSCLK
jgi:hypothetical protein